VKFVDYTSISVKAGNGGDGCIAFLREKFRPKGGPAGGDGGHGGSVYFQVSSNLSTLTDLNYKKHYYAGDGQNGKGKNMHGKNGEDIYIPVPEGTIVIDSDTKQILADLVDENQEYKIASGGTGGFGNARFKTQKITAPRIANNGKKGEFRKIDLELKVLADVGLVGLPNAGKSTFISKVSNAKPKIADYPFTTLVPNLGIVKYHDYKTFVIADIPGLIKDASKGKGLGNIFLKHIERTKILIYLIDLNESDIRKVYKMLYNELKAHDSDLIKKPSLILLTKTDSVSDEVFENIKKINKTKTIPVSSITGKGIDEAISQIISFIV
tara:strand:+ start:539 stop:1513 length:975 start_codon:yes stop_codon:yes gene_type:complete